MSEFRPFGFHLVENAVVKYQNAPSYSQIWGEVEAGRLIIDAGLCHEDVWILDVAIDARLKITEGVKKLSENQGADPCMEKLWKKWASEAPSHVLGDADCQSERVAKLITLGISDTLDVLLARGSIDPVDILKKWKDYRFTMSGTHPVLLGVNHDFIHTVDVLLKNGFELRGLEFNPFLKVKSAEMAVVLLRHDTGFHLKNESLIDETFKRQLPAGTLEEIVVAFQEYGGLSETKEKKLARLSVGLENKTNEQFQVEAKIAGWSPSLNRHEFSPVQGWVLREIANNISFNNESGALAWLRKQPSHGKVFPGNQYSDAKLAWAMLLPNNLAAAECHAQTASDMPDETLHERLKRYHGFLTDKGLLASGKFEKAISTCATSLCWRSVDDGGFAGFLNECFDEENDNSWILWSIQDLPRNDATLVTILEKSISCGEGSKGFSLVLALASTNPSKYVKSSITNAWGAGIRPFCLSEDWPRLEEISRKMGGDFTAQMQQWRLDQQSIPASISRPKHRL